jgi:hypothetical protein
MIKRIIQKTSHYITVYIKTAHIFFIEQFTSGVPEIYLISIISIIKSNGVYGGIEEYPFVP